LPNWPKCVAGLRGFELAYDEINMHPPKGPEGSVRPALSNGLKTSVLAGTRRALAGLSELDFVPERSIALHIASALVDAAPEPRRL
jgi:hypothetical protein